MATDSLASRSGFSRRTADLASALAAAQSQGMPSTNNRETDDWLHLLDKAEAVAPVDVAGYYKRAGVIIAQAARSHQERKKRP